MDYTNYCKLKAIDTIEESIDVEQNTFGFKVLATTLFVVSILILVLGFMAEESRTIVLIVGALILVVASLIHPEVRKRITLKI